MQNKKLKKYFTVSLGALSSLLSSDVTKAREMADCSPSNNSTNYHQFGGDKPFQNHQVQTPVSSDITKNSSKKNIKKPLPAKIINNNKSVQIPDRPIFISPDETPQPSNGFGLKEGFGLLFLGGMLGTYTWNEFIARPDWVDSLIWQRVWRTRDYHTTFSELKGTKIIDTPDEVKQWLTDSDADLLQHFSSYGTSNNKAALSLFKTIKDLYKKILNADGFKKLVFKDDDDLGLSEENRRQKIALELAVSHLANPLDDYLSAVGDAEATWTYCEQSLSEDMGDDDRKIEDDISDDYYGNFKYRAIIKRNGDNIYLGDFFEVDT